MESSADAAVLVLDRQSVLDGAGSIVEELAPRLLEAVDRRGWSLSVLLTDGRGIAEYNDRFMGRSHPTDVLAFPAGGGPTSSEAGEPTGQGVGGGTGDLPYLGDLVISVEQAAEQAPEVGNTVPEELQVLLIHGVLHLLGMDHETDGGEMEAREKELRARLIRDGVG